MTFKARMISKDFQPTMSIGVRDGHIYNNAVTTVANKTFTLPDFRNTSRPTVGFELYSDNDVLVSNVDEVLTLGAAATSPAAGVICTKSTWWRFDEPELSADKVYMRALTATATVYINPIYGRKRFNIGSD